MAFKKRKRIKPSSLQRSISRHIALSNKFKQSNNDYDRFVKGNYHSQCADKQIRFGRKLSRHEKENLYKTTEFYFFN